jgi:hypothetical protein
LRQTREFVDETPFFVVEQIIVALGNPAQYLAKVLQVIERIVEGRSAHGDVT